MNNRASQHNYADPFTAGQMVGMLVILTVIEQNEGISAETLEKLKHITATNAQVYLKKPTEDIHLMIEDLVKEVNTI